MLYLVTLSSIIKLIHVVQCPVLQRANCMYLQPVASMGRLRCGTTSALYSEDMWKNWDNVINNISDIMKHTKNGTVTMAPNHTAV